MKRFLALGLIGAGIFCVCPNASGQTILIIKNNASSIHNQISSLVETELKKSFSGFDITMLGVETTNQKQLIVLEPSLIITLGKNAARQVQYAPVKKLHALIPESFFSSLLACASAPCPDSDQSYAIHLDQPLERQLNLLRFLLPNAKAVGALTSKFSTDKIQELEKITAEFKLQFFYTFLQDKRSINQEFDKLLGLIDVFLALPDPLIHNRMTIQHLLLLTYRREIPVIGFSKAYVNAGAIAAVYSTPEQISRQISEFSVKILSAAAPEPGSYPPKFFSVAINKHVARSLDLTFPSPESVKLKLLALEK